MGARQEPRTERRGDYFRYFPISQRPGNCDVHGRATIAACGTWFEQVIDDFLQHECGLDGLADCDNLRVHTFESTCRFHRVFGFPDTIEAGLRVGEMGACAVRFEIGLFRVGEDKPVATGSVVRVFALDESDKPAVLPGALRTCLVALSHVDTR